MESVGRESVPQSAQTGDAERQTGPITHRAQELGTESTRPVCSFLYCRVRDHIPYLPHMATGTNSTVTVVQIIIGLVDEKGECDLVRVSFEQRQLILI